MVGSLKANTNVFKGQAGKLVEEVSREKGMWRTEELKEQSLTRCFHLEIWTQWPDLCGFLDVKYPDLVIIGQIFLIC